MSSFWRNEYKNKEYANMFDRNREILKEDFILLKSQTTLNKINRIIKRANILKVHACICSYLKEQMPTF